jgi:hypothetical protein
LQLRLGACKWLNLRQLPISINTAAFSVGDRARRPRHRIQDPVRRPSAWARLQAPGFKVWTHHTVQGKHSKSCVPCPNDNNCWVCVASEHNSPVKTKFACETPRIRQVVQYCCLLYCDPFKWPATSYIDIHPATLTQCKSFDSSEDPHPNFPTLPTMSSSSGARNERNAWEDEVDAANPSRQITQIQFTYTVATSIV